jgi:hypothetical protein
MSLAKVRVRLCGDNICWKSSNKASRKSCSNYPFPRHICLRWASEDGTELEGFLEGGLSPRHQQRFPETFDTLHSPVEAA